MSQASENHDDEPSAGPQVGRRTLLAGSAAAAATAAGAWSTLAGAGTAGAATRPNILLIITDDQPKLTQWATPKIFDWIAAQGVRFTNGHVTTPLCAPSRSSVYSSRYAHDHGVMDNGHPYRLNQNNTVQRYLKQAGYRNGFFGKYLNSWTLSDNPPHFDEWAMLQPSYVDGTYNVNGTVQTISGYTTNVLKNKTLNFLNKASTDPRPWFAVYTPYACHYNPAICHRGRRAQRWYGVRGRGGPTRL